MINKIRKIKIKMKAIAMLAATTHRLKTSEEIAKLLLTKMLTMFSLKVEVRVFYLVPQD